jgi:hypothetical protein
MTPKRLAEIKTIWGASGLAARALLPHEVNELLTAAEESIRLKEYAFTMRRAMDAFGVEGGNLPEFDKEYPDALKEKP